MRHRTGYAAAAKKMCAAGIGFIDVQDFQASTSASPRGHIMDELITL
jgi:hypothetical protein